MRSEQQLIKFIANARVALKNAPLLRLAEDLSVKREGESNLTAAANLSLVVTHNKQAKLAVVVLLLLVVVVLDCVTSR